mmetsp:Transcript_2313/g.8275  ORF Transcript_2313/g.8275 Transcript_2313/m.8275 type:complete len:112 (-) Transcript_2313:376-711(-)
MGRHPTSAHRSGGGDGGGGGEGGEGGGGGLAGGDGGGTAQISEKSEQQVENKTHSGSQKHATPGEAKLGSTNELPGGWHPTSAHSCGGGEGGEGGGDGMGGNGGGGMVQMS